MVFQQNLLKKSYFVAKMSGPAGQFLLLESALRLRASLVALNKYLMSFSLEHLTLRCHLFEANFQMDLQMQIEVLLICKKKLKSF